MDSLAKSITATLLQPNTCPDGGVEIALGGHWCCAALLVELVKALLVGASSELGLD